MKAFGKFLKQARLSAGLSQKDVSKECGYTTSQFVSNWENGKAYPTTKAIKILAELYSVDLNTFYNMILSSRTEIIKAELREQLFGEVSNTQENLTKEKKPRVRSSSSHQRA